MAARWAYGDEHKPIAFCEIDKYCQKVLKKHWPEVPIFEDIRSLDGRQFRPLDLVSGGFPCQPFSNAGQRKGKDDDRHLWPEYFRIIQQARPRWVVGENVAGIIKMELDNVLSDLEREGYTLQTLIIPACAVDARHRRDRIWIVANSNEPRTESDNGTDTKTEREVWREETSNVFEGCPESVVSDAQGVGLQGFRSSGKQESETHGGQAVSLCNSGDRTKWSVEPGLGRVANGIPNRSHRLKALGNAIVPQVAYELLRMIKVIDEQEKARENAAVGCSPAKI